MFEIPAGGRRYRALELLVKQKRLAKTAPMPCVVRDGGIAEEDTLAENVQRAPLHPLDQFRAFLALREKGQSEEEIAAAFFVCVSVVKQRLKLASVSPKLLDIYAEDGMTLDQLMAFTVNPDHERQEQVFERDPALPQQGALCHPPHADRGRRARLRQARAVRRHRRLCRRRRRRHARSVPGRRRRLAAGRRAASTVWSPRSWNARRKPSAPRAGNGSRSRPISPTATPTACASFAGERQPLTDEEDGDARRLAGRIRAA